MTAAPNVEIVALPAGEITAPAVYAYGPAGWRAGSVRMPLLAFLLRHPAQGDLLVDTGLHGDALAGAGRDFGVIGRTLFRGLRPAGQAFDAQLRAVGVAPPEIRTVVMTHLHLDHTSGMRLLPGAGFVITRAEWAAAHGRRATIDGYVADHLPGEDRVRLLDLAPGAEHDLLGDGSVTLLGTPGHSRGHLSVAARTAGGPVLLAGDAVYTQGNLAQDRLPLLSADRSAQQHSMELLRGWLRAHPDGRIVPSHDPGAWREL